MMDREITFDDLLNQIEEQKRNIRYHTHSEKYKYYHKHRFAEGVLVRHQCPAEKQKRHPHVTKIGQHGIE